MASNHHCPSHFTCHTSTFRRPTCFLPKSITPQPSPKNSKYEKKRRKKTHPVQQEFNANPQKQLAYIYLFYYNVNQLPFFILLPQTLRNAPQPQSQPCSYTHTHPHTHPSISPLPPTTHQIPEPLSPQWPSKPSLKAPFRARGEGEGGTREQGANQFHLCISIL